MTKRATSLLFTILFLLIGTASAWAFTSTTTFQPKDGVSGSNYTLSDIKIEPPFINSISTDYTYKNGSVTNQLGQYTVSSSGAQFGYKKSDQTKTTLFTINMYNLIPTKSYTFKFKIKVNGSNHDGMQFLRTLTGGSITDYNGGSNTWGEINNNYIKVTACNVEGSFEYKFTASTPTATFSLTWEWLGKDVNYAALTYVEVVGDANATIVSSNGDNICKGESNTFTAIAMSAPITWIYTDKSGNSTTLPETGTTVTFTNVQEGGTIKANSCEYPFKAVLCCNTQADREIVHLQPFNMPNTSYSQCSVENLFDENYDPYDIATSYGYGYFKRTHKCPGEDRDEIKNNTSNFTRDVEQLPTGFGPVEEHYVIAKTTQNMFAGWWHEDGDANKPAKPIKGHTQVEDPTNSSKDGFMVINCGRLAYDKDNLDKGKIFEYDIPGSLCTETWYDFSAWVCNLDQSTQHTFNPNVRFVVYGMNGTTVGEELLNFPTESINLRAQWIEKGGSFYSGNYNQFRVVLYNNQVPSDADACDIPGNDIGVDDISFTRCIPKLGVYTNEDRQGNAITMCNDGSELLNLYAGHPNYGITDMIEEPFYALMQSVEGGNWELVKKDDSPNNTYGYAKYELDVTGQGNTEYAVFVASKTTLLDNIIRHFEGKPKSQYSTLKESFNPGNLGCEIYAIGTSFTTVTMHCAEPRSKQPQAEDIALCGSDDLFDLNSLVTQVEVINPSTAEVAETIKRADYSSQADFLAAVAAKGELKWYDSNSDTATPISSNVPIATKDYWVSFDQKDASPITISESGKFKVTVTLLPTIVPTLNRLEVSGCLGDLVNESLRTFTVTSTTPEITDPVYKWYEVAADGTETLFRETESVVLPNQEGSGKLNLYVTSASGSACPSEVITLPYDIANNPTFDYEINVPCQREINTTGVQIKYTNMSGSTAITIYRDGNIIKQETLPAGTTEYAYTDLTISSTATTVEYKLVLGSGGCNKTVDNLDYDIVETNQYEMTSTTTKVGEGDNAMYYACKGSNVVILATFPNLKADEYYKWSMNGTVIPGYEQTKEATYLLTNIQEKTTISTEIVGTNTCGGSASITINVEDVPAPVLSVTNSNAICVGSTNTVTYTEGSTLQNPTYQWYETYNGTKSEFSTAIAPLNNHQFNQAGTYTYELTVTNGNAQCEATSNSVTVEVAPIPQFSVNATPNKICLGEPDGTKLQITMATSLAESVTETKWTLNDSPVTGTMTQEVAGSNTIYSLPVHPSTAGNLTYTAHVTAVCTDTKSVQVQVDEAPTTGIQDYSVCKDGTVKLMLEITNGTGSGFQWLPTTGLDNPNIQTPTLTAAAVNQQQIEYTVTFKSGECPLEEKTTVKINDLPVITKLVTTQVARQIEVDVNGMTPTFTIDQMETVYDVPAIVSELPFGWRRIYVTDINDCKTDSTIYIEPVEIKPMPSFSPNDEGAKEREKWTVHNLDQYHSYIIEIFDRYGRRLWEYRTGSFSKDGKNGSEPFGWDGMYNGHQMPSDDYWYLITVEEIRKQYTGHFILKR